VTDPKADPAGSTTRVSDNRANAAGVRPRWPAVPGIAYGGDYNPEQWPADVWADDVARMVQAHVSMVTVGVFSWALLEPTEGHYDFSWLDTVLGLLHENGIAVDLATSTASPPAWLARHYPASLPVTREGNRMWPGSRQAFCPSSVDYRRGSTSLARALATRYGTHPAVVMWHVNNEYGCHTAQCFCDVSAAAFRGWLTNRYGTIETLNDVWGTAFWSQHYAEWDEVLPPRLTPSHHNPTQSLDWLRFSDAELLSCFTAERDVLREITPHLPVTTNFMGTFKPLDYFSWAREEDVVSNDHYLLGADPASHVHLAMSADLVRSTGDGRPWILMEHSTSAVNWQPRNLAKAPGQMRRNSLQHVARGADAVCFFQWRASAKGAEKFHSAMMPHAGTDTKVWREVVELGADLLAIADVAGSRVESRVAIVWDWQAWWAVELEAHPSIDVTYLDFMRQTYEALWRLGITVDFVPPDADLSGYHLVAVPSLYLVSDQAAANITAYVEGGGHLVCTFFSGIVDPGDAVRLGGYPGAFRRVLGVRVEEFFPLAAGQTVALSDGSTGRIWSEMVHLEGATAVASFVDGPVAGSPAVTRHAFGSGVAHYLSSFLDTDALTRLLSDALAAAGVRGVGTHGADVEVVRRRDDDGVSYLFVINHSSDDVDVPSDGEELLRGAVVAGSVTVEAGGVAVVRERSAGGSRSTLADSSIDGAQSVGGGSSGPAHELGKE
jgi:beta-galactosidase